MHATAGSQLVLVTLLSLGIPGCINDNAEPPTDKLVMLRDSKWHSWPSVMERNNLKAIPVCWVNAFENNEDPDKITNIEMSKIIKNTITQAYGELGICFSGWETCTSNDYPSIRLELQFDGSISHNSSYSYGTSGWSYVGNSSDSRTMLIHGGGTWPSQQSLENSMGGIAIHEFGHALGARHEHMRTDVTGDLCEYASEDREDHPNERFDPDSTKSNYEVLGNHDPDSIMHYCSEINVLSDNDKIHFEEYYNDVDFACSDEQPEEPQDPLCDPDNRDESDPCSSACKCAAGEGGCENDGECQSGLFCNANAGSYYDLSPELSICEEIPLFDSNYCSASRPCGEGHGDCDNDSECESHLRCKHNVGDTYGQPRTVDVCDVVELFDWDYCSNSHPCGSGEGDCDRDSHCESGLSCRHNVGANYGRSRSLDICE
jgi:hypothetical protein